MVVLLSSHHATSSSDTTDRERFGEEWTPRLSDDVEEGRQPSGFIPCELDANHRVGSGLDDERRGEQSLRIGEWEESSIHASRGS